MSSPTEGYGILREACPTKFAPSTLEQWSKDIFLVKEKSNGRAPLLETATPEKNDLTLAADAVVDVLLSDRRKRQLNKKKPAITLKRLEKDMTQMVNNNKENIAVVENSSIQKMLAKVCLATGKELEGCCHLVASHAACFRQKILYRHVKSKLRNAIFQEPLVDKLDPKHLDLDHTNANTNPNTIMSTLKELPSEWHVVQLTSEHEHLTDIMDRRQTQESNYSLKPTHGLHLIVLPTGKDAINPICLTVPKPNNSSTYDIRLEMETLLNNNKSDLTTTFTNHDLYWRMRKKQNDRMKSAITELEFSWLREWRILLLGDYTEHLDLIEDIHNMIDKLIADSTVKEISDRTRWLLRKIATGACFLKSFEIERAVKHVLPTQTKLAKNIILSIIAKTKVMDPLKFAERKILVLIVDESLDHISYESMSFLKYQPVTRFPSLHIAYALFKLHKDSISGGYKIIRKSDDLGTFIVNPSQDLKKMEMRMKSFLNYWLPKWKGLYGIKPDLEFFKASLTKYDVLMYNGHGSGMQFLRAEEIEKMRVMATVLLFGCSSIKLLPAGGRLPGYGVSNQYLMGCSPCILGMLWEVTDGDIDKMTAKFMSLWISSPAKRAWSDVDQQSWHTGKLEFKVSRDQIVNEDNMLVAVAKSKNECKQYMTSSAIVVRGLPIKLSN